MPKVMVEKLKREAGAHAAAISEAAFAGAETTYKGDLAKAAAVAIEAVKEHYEQNDKGEWGLKAGHEYKGGKWYVGGKVVESEGEVDPELTVGRGQRYRVQEWFPLGAVEPVADTQNDFLVEFLTHGLTGDGKRYYPKQVQEAAVTAGIFEGVKMYINHADVAADARRGHRDLRDWGATIREGSLSCVDGNVRGICHAHTPEALAILNDPVARKAVGFSHDSFIRANQKVINGKPCHIVESIDKCNSVDFVPAGNASGRVLEALADTEEVPEMALETLTLEQLREARPELVEQITKGATDAEQQRVKEAADKVAAEAAAKEAADKAAAEKTTTPAEDQRVTEALKEAKEAKAESATLREKDMKRDTAEVVKRIVEAEPRLSEVSKQRVLETFSDQIIAADQIGSRVKEACEKEEAYALALLKGAGVRTKVAGAGSAEVAADKQVRESYRQEHADWMRAHGLAEAEIEAYLKQTAEK